MSRERCDYCGTEGPTEALALRDEGWWLTDQDGPPANDDTGPRLVCTAPACRQQAIADGVLPLETRQGDQVGLVPG